MIRFALNQLLAQKHRTILDVYRATGLTRSTLTNLAKGTSRTIAFTTVDKLCRDLDVTPNDLLEFVSATMTIATHIEATAPVPEPSLLSDRNRLKWPLTVDVTIQTKSNSITFAYAGTVYWATSHKATDPLRIELAITKATAAIAVAWFQQLSAAFADDVKQMIPTRHKVNVNELVATSESN
ncbi:helix-turn-helix transcriptional regulator [Lacticaseibacillus zeae]|uniref:Helix-turn-helix transcriptional regulator n=1 Tax=Lacticaseibacillus zeae TaxID=57037 RepID=A0A5R8LSD7_LACZE|nr:helix-turn-helix transcriptional regulator [Lacticaseibacillus zeae]TLF40172.1 helix-turn-helix transcriptional regulator [Lacticaseibacillus zeae]